MLPKEGGKLGWMQWAKLAVDYIRIPRFNPVDMTSDNKSVMAFNLSFMFDKKELLTESMNYLLSLVTRRELKVAEVTEYRFEDVGLAHQALESGMTVGKLVLTIE